jgi:hypothetical protein
MYPPDTNEINGNGATKRRLETPSLGVIAGFAVELERRGNLLDVVS